MQTLATRNQGFSIISGFHSGAPAFVKLTSALRRANSKRFQFNSIGSQKAKNIKSETERGYSVQPFLGHHVPLKI